jgi:ABC-2 type transport system ATP-binding protein
MSDVIVSIDGLRLRRPGRTGFEVDDVSLVVPRGSVVGLVGPNGSGKTTIIRALLGLVVPDAGEIRTFGEPAGSPAALSRIGVVLDRPRYPEDWPVASVSARLRPFYPAWSHSIFLDACTRLRVPPERKVGELSKGEGIKLVLASALAQQPDLLVLDEPSSGLDAPARREIVQLIRDFMNDPDHAVLFSTHIADDLDQLADTLVVVSEGRVVRNGPLRAVVDAFAAEHGTTRIDDIVIHFADKGRGGRS